MLQIMVNPAVVNQITRHSLRSITYMFAKVNQCANATAPKWFNISMLIAALAWGSSLSRCNDRDRGRHGICVFEFSNCRAWPKEDTFTVRELSISSCHVKTMGRVSALMGWTGFVSGAVGGRSQAVNRMGERAEKSPCVAGELEGVEEDSAEFFTKGYAPPLLPKITLMDYTHGLDVQCRLLRVSQP